MPEWTRGQLRAELLAHGFHYLPVERANGFVQRSMEETIQEFEFPFRERTETVTPGDELEGLGKVEQVQRADGAVLAPRRRDELIDRYGASWNEGTPEFYFFDGQSRVSVYPTSTELVTVRHFSRAVWVRAGDGALAMSAVDDLDVPVIPSDFLDVPLLLARAYAKEDVDNRAEAVELRTRYRERLTTMIEALKHREVDELMRIRVTDGYV